MHRSVHSHWPFFVFGAIKKNVIDWNRTSNLFRHTLSALALYSAPGNYYKRENSFYFLLKNAQIQNAAHKTQSEKKEKKTVSRFYCDSAHYNVRKPFHYFRVVSLSSASHCSTFYAQKKNLLQSSTLASLTRASASLCRCRRGYSFDCGDEWHVNHVLPKMGEKIAFGCVSCFFFAPSRSLAISPVIRVNNFKRK